MTNGSQRASESVTDAIERYGDMVFRLAYARTRCRADAEDIFQDVFLRLMGCQPENMDAEHIKAWLIRSTANASINILKSAQRRYTARPRDAASAPFPERDEALHAALMALPKRARATIHLFYYEDMSAEDIAKALGEKPSTIRTRLTRGRRKLKQLLIEQEDDV